jgi:hypothetical protein
MAPNLGAGGPVVAPNMLQQLPQLLQLRQLLGGAGGLGGGLGSMGALNTATGGNMLSSGINQIFGGSNA